MKAITYTRYGPPEVLRLDEVAKPVPKDDELVIRVHAAEATKSDVEMRRFKFAVKWFWLPLRIAFGAWLGEFCSARPHSLVSKYSDYSNGPAVAFD